MSGSIAGRAGDGAYRHVPSLRRYWSLTTRGQADFNCPPLRRRKEDARAKVHAAGVNLPMLSDRGQSHQSTIMEDGLQGVW